MCRREELPDQLVQAFISAEDRTFFEHSGIDLWGMFRGAVLNPLMGKRRRADRRSRSRS